MTRSTDSNVIQPPRRRWFSYLTWRNIFIVWLVGQIIELNRALASKIEITKTTLRGAARDNTLTITYDHPSLIGPWAGSLIVQIIIGIVLFLLLIRWILKKVRGSGSN